MNAIAHKIGAFFIHLVNKILGFFGAHTVPFEHVGVTTLGYIIIIFIVFVLFISVRRR